MEQSRLLIDTLKKALRAAGLTYADVAKELNLSEASVKRLFSQGNFSLERLEKTAALAQLDLGELVDQMRNRQQLVNQLTEAQEEEIASDMLLVLVAISVINGCSKADLLHGYYLSEAQIIRKLAQLDRLKIIELLPGDRIRLLVSPNFHWRPRGPIQRLFREKVEKDFFNSQFDGDSEKLIVLNGIISPAANAELQKRMETLAVEFNELMQREARLPMENKKGNTMVIALWQWQYSLFAKMARQS